MMVVGLTATQIVNFIFSNGSIVYQLAEAVRDLSLMLVASLSIIGFIFFFVRLILYRESYSFSDLLRIVVIPAVAIAMLTPTPEFRGGIALWIVEQIFNAGAYITDKITVGVGVGKAEMSGTPPIGDATNVMWYYNGSGGTVKFTELAKDFKDTAQRSLEAFKENLKTSVNDDVVNPGDFEHTGAITGTLAFLVGFASGVSDGLVSGGALMKALTGGVKGLGIYLVIKWISGNAVDIIWRLSIILWIIKVSAIVIGFPISVLVIALAFEWGLQNLTKVLLNVIGIAITPVIMVSIFTGGAFAYQLMAPIVEGANTGISLLMRMFFDIAYPVIVAGALLRSGEIVSYLIGVSSFAIASLGAEYVKPQRIAYDAMPVK
jgi:hypothetical protein